MTLVHAERASELGSFDIVIIERRGRGAVEGGRGADALARAAPRCVGWTGCAAACEALARFVNSQNYRREFTVVPHTCECEHANPCVCVNECMCV